MKIHFVPNRGRNIAKEPQEQTIYFRYSLGRNLDFCVTMGFKVNVSTLNQRANDWDFEKQRLKDRTTIANRYELNSLMDRIQKGFTDYTLENKKNGIIPSYDAVRTFFDSFTVNENEEAKKEVTFFSHFDSHVEHLKQHAPSNKTTLVSQRTIKSYAVTKNLLELFQKSHGKIKFESFTDQWYLDFVKYCQSKDLSHNYIGRHIKTLKAVVHSASRKYRDNQTIQLAYLVVKDYKVLKEEAYNVYLTESELESIWKLDLSHDQRKELARDLFLIGAYTGLRVSDYNNLNKDNFKEIDGNLFVEVETKKTGARVVVPVHPIVKSILDKNNGKPPKRIPDQHINKLIKEVAESAEIDSVVKFSKTIGGKRVEVKQYKFELIKTHTARRSFCSNAYLSGIDTADIMKLSGHTTEQAFKNYLKLSAEETAIRMSQNDFFSKERFNNL